MSLTGLSLHCHRTIYVGQYAIEVQNHKQ